MKRSPLRIFAAACIVVTGLCIISAIVVKGWDRRSLTSGDFIQYWAAEQQLVHGANPYDPNELLRLESAEGLEGGVLKISISPPVAYDLALPLGLVGAKLGLLLWMLVLAACAAASIWILGILFGRQASQLHIYCYLFPPLLACFLVGQLGIFLLLGLVLFLFWRESRPFLAGVLLFPYAMKPHLLAPFGLVLLLWMVYRKSYRILAGFSVALLANCALTLCLDHQIWSQYRQAVHTMDIVNIYVPSLSQELRRLLDHNATWIQFLPEAAGCLWALWYFRTRRARWNWMDHGMILLLISVAVAPYAWLTDEALLLPAVLAGLYQAVDLRRSTLPLILIVAVAQIEIFNVVRVNSPYYLWTVPAYLAWYLYAAGRIGARAGQARSDAAIGG
jgi:hypothetical protein